MKTKKTISPILAVLILALALPLSGCSSEPKPQPQAATESKPDETKPISQKELEALREAARKGTLTQKDRLVLEEAEALEAQASDEKTRAWMNEYNKRYFDDDNKENQKKTP